MKFINKHDLNLVDSPDYEIIKEAFNDVRLYLSTEDYWHSKGGYQFSFWRDEENPRLVHCNAYELSNPDDLEDSRTEDGHFYFLIDDEATLRPCLPLSFSDVSEPLFLCEWNGFDIVEVHTISSFYETYKSTNLFEEVDIVGYEVLEEMRALDLGEVFRDDNMGLTRIK